MSLYLYRTKRRTWSEKKTTQNDRFFLQFPSNSGCAGPTIVCVWTGAFRTNNKNVYRTISLLTREACDKRNTQTHKCNCACGFIDDTYFPTEMVGMTTFHLVNRRHMYRHVSYEQYEAEVYTWRNQQPNQSKECSRKRTNLRAIDKSDRASTTRFRHILMCYFKSARKGFSHDYMRMRNGVWRAYIYPVSLPDNNA